MNSLQSRMFVRPVRQVTKPAGNLVNHGMHGMRFLQTRSMDDQALHTAAPVLQPVEVSVELASTDRRELVAPVAAWLVELGFQVHCGPLPDSRIMDVIALWRAPSGEAFEFRLVTHAKWATCECIEYLGPWTSVCFASTVVENEVEVRWLLLRNRRFQQANKASLPPGAAPGAIVPALAPNPHAVAQSRRAGPSTPAGPTGPPTAAPLPAG